MKFTTAIQTCFRKYITFSGRAPRSEFWWFLLFYTVLERLAKLADGFLGVTLFGDTGPLALAAAVTCMLPYLAVLVRRMHDTERSGLWLLLPLGLYLGLIPLEYTVPNAQFLAILVPAVTLFGLIALLYWTVQKGDAFENRYGPDPLAPAPQPAPPSGPQEIPQWTGPETRS